MSEQLISPPKASASTNITQLGYVSAHDAIVGRDYAYVAYKEEDTRNGKWKLKISAKAGTGMYLDPEHPSVRSNISKAATNGETFINVGPSMTPSDNDQRYVENRIHFDSDLNPASFEMLVAMRNEDGTQTETQSTTFPWPGLGEEKEEKQLVSAPESNDRVEITPLAYLCSYDAMIDKDYAYAAYKEENRQTGKWQFVIKATVTAGMNLNPEHSSLRTNMAKAAVEGKEFINVGFHLIVEEDDPRQVENRLFFDQDLNPLYLEMHLVTRNADGTPKEKQFAKIDWPGTIERKPVVSAPESSSTNTITPLGYIESYDVIADKDYGYAAYKELNNSTGKWRLRVSASVTAGLSLDPEHPSFAKNIATAADEGKDHVVVGYEFTTSDENDVRKVQSRVYFGADQKPTHFEMDLVTRNADGSPKPMQSMRFDWPA